MNKVELEKYYEQSLKEIVELKKTISSANDRICGFNKEKENLIATVVEAQSNLHDVNLIANTFLEISSEYETYTNYSMYGGNEEKTRRIENSTTKLLDKIVKISERG